MKRKDDEKVSGKPMFPRLHVNDTERGGPRAPPRNKMALYEQLSIPSQRFNHGVLPLNSNSNSNMVPPAGQGSGLEGNMFRPHHLSLRATRMNEESRARQLDDSNLNTPLVQVEQGEKVGEEDDFQVPVFVQSVTGQDERKTPNGGDRGKPTPFSTSYSVHSTKVDSTSGRNAKQISSPGNNSRHEAEGQHRENSDGCMLNMDQSVKSPRRKRNESSRGANSFPDREDQDHLVVNLSRLHETDASYHHECSSRPQSEDRGHDANDKGSTQGPSSDSHSVGVNCNEPDDHNEYSGDQMCGSRPTGNVEKSDDVSETSMVDSISGTDISPDDVVGIIGQKRFWKARRAIVNQQRVFAVQVFELHKLIKVQKLIASSPHLLHEDSAYLLEPSLKGSPVKKLPEYVVKPSLIMKRKNEPQKVNNKVEWSAENAVARTSTCAKSGTQPPSYGPYVGNHPPTPVATDNMGSWGFQQTPGHQWLIPVMTPSEGLVYKPYHGPGFMGAGCGGGCGPFVPNALTGYGVPAHQQFPPGMGYFPGAPPIGHSYFSPYGVPVMSTPIPGSAVEQTNHCAGPAPIAHGQFQESRGANSNAQHQGSWNEPTQKSGTIPNATKVQVPKDSGWNGSTASCLSERARGTGTGLAAEGRDSRRLSPMAPAVQESQAVPQAHDNREQPTRVIRVVPHNPRSATESAARIFHSIQKERKQYDSI